MAETQLRGSSRTLRIDNAVVFDGVSEELREGSILIVDGVIVDVGSTDSGGEAVLDARGSVVVPGFIDAHFHAYAAGIDMLELESSPLSYIALMATRRLRAALERGFTTVRDVAGGDAGLGRAIAEGIISSPRYLYTGPALTQTGGHGDPRPAGQDLCACGGHLAEIVDGVDALRRAVRSRFHQGAHAIKVMTSGGVVSPADPLRIPQYSAEEIRAVCDEADRRGSYVAAHAYSPEAIVHSVANGVRSIEHGNLLDATSAAAMKSHDAFLVPTLAAYDAMKRRGAELGMAQVSRDKNEEVLLAGQEALEIARAAGVPIGFGTDLMGDLEDEQLQGFRLQVEADGVSEVLRSATSVNATLLGRADLGRIGAGCQGDLVVLGGNPFENPALLWTTSGNRTVVQSGRIVHPRDVRR